MAFIKLTEGEFENAKKYGTNYWIYLINFLENEETIILKIKEPIKKLKWEEKEE